MAKKAFELYAKKNELSQSPTMNGDTRPVLKSASFGAGAAATQKLTMVQNQNYNFSAP